MGLTFYEEVTQQQREQTNGEKYAAEVVALPGELAAAWADPTQAFDARRYGSVTIWCLSAPAAARAIEASPDNQTWVGQTAVSNTPAGIGTTASISGVGRYILPGGGFIHLAAGTGTFQISAQ